MATARKLGRGLESLLATRHAERHAEPDGTLWIEVEKLRPNRNQPRQDLEKGVARLADSIRRHGLMQPIVVIPGPSGEYEILAGERRWRAAQIAGLKAVPVIIREHVRNDGERLELALIENVQREDLDPIERAAACKRLLDDYELTQAEVAERLGYERSSIANLVRLLELPEAIQEAVSRETITAGHARALLRLNGKPEQARVLKKLVQEGWSVRQAEQVCAQAATGKLKPEHRARPRQAGWVMEMQEKVTRRLGARCEVRLLRKGGGRLMVHFQDMDDLDRIHRLLDLPDETSELLEGS